MLAFTVLVLVLVRRSQGVDVFVAATATLVVTAWVTVAVTYAADCARRHTASPALDFPGEPATGFADYLHFSLSVSTTFGSTDVTVTSASGRRVVLVHGLVAFVFNTVVLALLVSALLG